MPRSAGLFAALSLAVAGFYCYLTARAAVFIVVISAVCIVCYRACLTEEARRDLGQAPLIAACAMPLVAWLSPSIWPVYTAMLAIVPLCARDAGRAAALYLFCLLLLPGLDWTMNVGALKLFEFGVHDALVCGAAAVVFRRGGRAPVPFRLDLPVVALLALMVAATARDTSVTNILRVAVNTTLDCGLPYYVLSRGVRGADDVRRCMIHLGAAAVILAAVLCYEMYAAWPIYNALYSKFGIPVLLLVKLRGGILRAGGPFLEPTSIAMILAFCFMAVWQARRAFASPRLHGAVLAVIAIGMVPPQSRGAWIGLLIGTALIDVYRGRLATLAIRGLVVGVAVSALLAAAHVSPQLSESVGLSGGASDTVDYRRRLLDRGMQEFRHSPLTGYSTPEILARLSDLRQGEGIVDFVNTYVYFALIGGIVGLGIFIGTFLAYLLGLWRRRAMWRTAIELDGAAFLFGAIAMPLEMLFFTSLGGRVQIFLFVFFGLATAVIASHMRIAAGQPINGRSSMSAPSPAAPPASAAAASFASSPRFSSPARRSAHQL